MKVLLDENVPILLRQHMADHECFSVKYMGWDSLENGALLVTAAEAGFDAMLTLDIKMPGQHSWATMRLPVLVIHLPGVRGQKMPALLRLLPDILRLLATNPPPGFHHVGKSEG